MVISVAFSDPSQITKNILEPDRLEIVITWPELIVDEQSGEQLEQEFSSFFLSLQRQFTA